MTDLVVQPGLPLSDHRNDSVDAHTSSVKVDGKRRNLPIQWLRALAALSVMFYHSGVYFDRFLHDDTFATIFTPALGFIGVALFFAISGYLMSIAIRVQTPSMFLAHRIVRIFPIYLVIANGFFFIAGWIGDSFDYDWKSLLLLALPRLKPFLSVEWTLIFEIAFYAILFLIACAGFAKRIGIIAAVWLGIIALVSLLDPDSGATVMFPLYRLLFVSACVAMAGGLLIPYAASLKIPSGVLLGLGGLLFILGLKNPLFLYDTSRWVFGISAILIVWGAVTLSDTSRVLRLGWAGKGFARLGDYSYALYLVHVPIMRTLYPALADKPHDEIWTATLIAILLTTIVFGELDLLLYGRFKRGLRQLSARAVSLIAVSSFACFTIGSTYGSIIAFQHDRDVAKITSIAETMLEAHPIHTREDAIAAVQAAGFTLSSRIVGSLDRNDWNKTRDGSGVRTIDLWGADLDKPRWPVWIMLFRGGALWEIESPDFVRDDIRSLFHIDTKTGYFGQTIEPCQPDQYVVAVVVGQNKRFAVLPENKPYVACP